MREVPAVDTGEVQPQLLDKNKRQKKTLKTPNFKELLKTHLELGKMRFLNMQAIEKGFPLEK